MVLVQSKPKRTVNLDLARFEEERRLAAMGEGEAGRNASSNLDTPKGSILSEREGAGGG